MSVSAWSICTPRDWWIEHEDERKRMEHLYAEEADRFRLDDCVDKMEQMFRDEIARVAAQG